MASTKIVATFAICVSILVICTPVQSLFYSYSMMPYLLMNQLEDGWKLCEKNNTDRLEYLEIFNNASRCYYDITNTNQSICISLEQNVQTCSAPMVEYLEECLPEKSKDLPKFFEKTLISLVHTFCGSTGELLLEVFNPCIYEYFEQKDESIKKECKREALEPKLDKLKDEAPSKSEICQIGREVGNCWQDHINQECGSSKAKEAFSKFYNAVVSPCKE